MQQAKKRAITTTAADHSLNIITAIEDDDDAAINSNNSSSNKNSRDSSVLLFSNKRKFIPKKYFGILVLLLILSLYLAAAGRIRPAETTNVVVETTRTTTTTNLPPGTENNITHRDPKLVLPVVVGSKNHSGMDEEEENPSRMETQESSENLSSSTATHCHCQKFTCPPSPPALAWEQVYSLEWNESAPAMVGMPPNDTHFPTTRFTAHVQELVRRIDIKQMESDCFWKFTLTTSSSSSTLPRGEEEGGRSPTDSRPTKIVCQGKPQQRLVPWWCTILERLFQKNVNSDWNDPPSPPNPESANIYIGSFENPGQQSLLDPVLPTTTTTVSFAVSSDDFYKKPRPKPRHGSSKKKQHPLSPYTCLANSAPNGTFAITNFLELQRMADRTTYPILPWDQRCSVPIWRGSAWIGIGTKKKNGRRPPSPIIYNSSSTSTTASANWTNATHQQQFPILHQALQDCPRCRAVEISQHSPLLLDAKFGDPKNGFFHPLNTQYQEWWKHNATNGLDRLLPIHYIPSMEYYSHYQTVLVLCGLGAAFRTPIHLSTATAVVLQDCPHHEWYHGYGGFEPWKHFIPLREDLTDLSVILEWIRDHPDQVRSIAMAGRQFYQEYLSFQRNYEHFYEFIYRLAWKKAAHSGNETGASAVTASMVSGM